MDENFREEYILGCLMLVIAYCIIVQYTEHTRWRVRHTEHGHINFEENWVDYLNDAFPAVSRVPEAPSMSALRSNQCIGKCITCLAPAAARCSGCRLVPYCSRNCQLIHWRKEHMEKCHKLRSRPAKVAVRSRIHMDFAASMKSLPHGADAKKCAVQEGTYVNHSGSQTEKQMDKKGVGKSKKTEVENGDGVQENHQLSDISSQDSSGIATIEEILQNQDGTISENIPANQDESIKEMALKNKYTNNHAKTSPLKTGDTYADFEASIHHHRNTVNHVKGHSSGEGLLSGSTGSNRPSYSSELEDNKVAKEHLLDLKKPQDVPFQTENSSIQPHETNRLQEELKKLEKLRDELLNENTALRNMQATKQNDMDNMMEFSYLELKEATNNFDEKLKIGEGAYGSVYKAVLHCTTVAIKILHPGGNQGEREFYQEVEILSKVRHPNIITLIGGCSQYLALVYEFMPNGCLEDCLVRGRRTLYWNVRIEIASNICSALIFLHSTKPHGIAHGDLKLANILLNSNYEAKLGDFGISCRLMKTNDTITPHHLTEYPKGTLAYIDPEYMRTGEMNPQCDVYSFGIILLQLVTGKSATGISKSVEEALQNNRLNKQIDKSAKWPSDKAIKMAKLGLRCCNPTRKNRPHLATDVWNEIESLKANASY